MAGTLREGYLSRETLVAFALCLSFACGSDVLVVILIVKRVRDPTQRHWLRRESVTEDEGKDSPFSTQLEIFRASRNAKEEGRMHAVVALAKVCINARHAWTQKL